MSTFCIIKKSEPKIINSQIDKQAILINHFCSSKGSKVTDVNLTC